MRRARVRRDLPLSLKTAALLGRAHPKSQDPESPALHPVTDPGPEDRPTPVALTAGRAAPAILPEAIAEVDGEEGSPAHAAADTVVLEVAVERTVGVTPGVALTPIGGGQGQTRTTATQVEVAA